MKLIVVTLFLVGMIAQASGYGDFETNTYARLDLSELLIDADRIVVCVPQLHTVRENDDQLLFELEKVDEIVNDKNVSTNQPVRSFIVRSKSVFFGSPVLLRGRKQLLFLLEKKIDGDFLDKYGLEQPVAVYELCSSTHASICLDFSVESLARNILKEKYNIDKEAELVMVVKNLSEPRIKGLEAPDIIQNLLDKLNSTEAEAQSMYYDNIVPMLKRLGVEVERTQGGYSRKEKVPESVQVIF